MRGGRAGGCFHGKALAGWAIESFGTFSDGGDDDGGGDECGSDIIPGLGELDDNPTASVDLRRTAPGTPARSHCCSASKSITVTAITKTW